MYNTLFSQYYILQDYFKPCVLQNVNMLGFTIFSKYRKDYMKEFVVHLSWGCKIWPHVEVQFLKYFSFYLQGRMSIVIEFDLTVKRINLNLFHCLWILIMSQVMMNDEEETKGWSKINVDQVLSKCSFSWPV